MYLAISSMLERFGKAQLVTIGVEQMKESLAPFGIPRGRFGVEAVSDRPFIQGVHVQDVKDDASPPRPLPGSRLRDQVEVTWTEMKARERSVFTAGMESESERAIEMNGTRHVVGRESYGADRGNRRCCPAERR